MSLPSSKKSISILVADDYSVVCEQSVNLGVMSGLNIIAMVDKSEKAIEAYFRLKPDIVLLNFNLKRVNSLETIRIIREGDPSAMIILLTEICNPVLMANALSSGARGICFKQTDTDRIRVGIDCVVRGEIWLDEAVLEPLVAGALRVQPFNQQVGARQQAGAIREVDLSAQELALSEREVTVLRLIAKGYSNKKIASELFISAETVKTHVRRIMERLAANDRTEAAVKAVKANLL